MMTITERNNFSLDCQAKYNELNVTEIETQRALLEGVKISLVSNMRSILYKSKNGDITDNIELLYIFADSLLKTQIELNEMDKVILYKLKGGN